MTREALLELQDYDLWANRRWLEALDRFPNAERARAIYRHILSCQYNWLAVVMSYEESGTVADDLVAETDRLFAAWRDVLVNGDPNAYASYERQGTPHFHMVSEIAHHVFNHGTYHRGHLRGLAEAAEFDDFPETDFIRWLREAPASPV
jgi:uncharacterized damage-inducible protein DinB